MSCRRRFPGGDGDFIWADLTEVSLRSPSKQWKTRERAGHDFHIARTSKFTVSMLTMLWFRGFRPKIKACHKATYLQPPPTIPMPAWKTRLPRKNCRLGGYQSSVRTLHSLNLSYLWTWFKRKYQPSNFTPENTAQTNDSRADDIRRWAVQAIATA